ncbi:MAG TPA: PAS domain-containing protein, partial [Paracoccaceae bacterium]|nr:PAS domain-containing protein [Paracoccaceae bacterium]
RAQAEALLEAKSRALFDTNRALVAEAEALRRALVEVEDLRARNQAALQTQSVLFAVLDAVAAARSPGAGLRALLEVIARVMPCAAVAVIEDAGAEGIGVVAALPADLAGRRIRTPPGLLDRARRLPDLAQAGWDMPDDPALAGARGGMMAPLRIPGERPLALLCLSGGEATFTADDLALLERVAQVAADPLGSLRLARRNAALAALLEGTPLPEDPAPSGIDVSFQSVNRAFERLTKAQALTVDILNDLLTAPSYGVDAAIQRALARLGQDSGADRTFLLGPVRAGSAVPSHDWARQSLPPALPDLARALDRLSTGHEALLDADAPGLAARVLLVPVLAGGHLAGVLGHAMPDTARGFLPGEVNLLRSVGHAIHAILRRTAAEAESRDATDALAAERNRLALTLSALPDLVLELDAEGRFTDRHSGGIRIPREMVARFNGVLPEQALPPDLAAACRRVLTRLAETGQADPQEVQFDLGQGLRWLQVNVVLRGRDAGGAPAGFLMVLRDITRERDQAAEIARLSEVARRTTNLVVVTDAQRRITWVNAAFETTTGWTLAEVKGRRQGDFLHSARTDAATVAAMRAAQDAGRAVQVELLKRNRLGVDYWLQIDIQPLHDADGRLTGFMSVETDITVNKAQELALEYAAAEAERARVRLVAAVDALQDGFALFDAEDRLVLCNDRYRELYPLSSAVMVPGVRFEDILRHGLAQGEYPAARGREAAWLAETLAAHQAPESRMEVQLLNGRWIRIFERVTPDGGRVGLRVDITALKEAEARALADRAAAMDASLDAIAITDRDGRFLYANPAFAALTRAGGPLTGRGWRPLFAPDIVTGLRARVLPRLERHGTWQGDLAGYLADGTPVDLDISLTRRPDGAVLWIMRDLTERHRAEVERNRLREDLHLAQRREVIGQLSAGLAHDFNNLIAAISGSAALIGTETGPRAGDRILAHATRIQRAAGQAEGLVRRLLALGARSSQHRAVDLSACLREAADLLRPGLPKGLRLVLDLPEVAVSAQTDPTDILQLVLNLGLNARDAMAGHPAPPGGHVLTLGLQPGPCPAGDALFRIGTLAPGCAHACISVTDTGPGLSAEIAQRAFSPYFTSKGDKGSGLGLSIVQGITLAAQGELGLLRGPQGGARFVLRWPLAATAQAARPDADPDADPEPGPAGIARLDGRAILLVDDAEDVLDVLASVLDKAGAEVAPSTSPADILDVLADDPDAFDVVVTDFDMPGMTGADLARATHALRPGLPVVLVTALPDWRGRDSIGAADPRFAAVLAKPVTAQALVEGILGALSSDTQ